MFGRTCRQQSGSIPNLKVKPISGYLDKAHANTAGRRDSVSSGRPPNVQKYQYFMGLVLLTEGSTMAHFYGMICGSGFGNNYGGRGDSDWRVPWGEGGVFRLISTVRVQIDVA